MTSTLRVAGAGELGDHVRHVPRREELALLHVDGAAGLRRPRPEIGLAAEERRDLQHVDRLRDARALRRPRARRSAPAAPALADLRKDRQRRVEPDAARALRAGAVRLVERGLVDEADPERAPAISFSADAISSACARLSSAHGPAISASGKALPKRTCRRRSTDRTTGCGLDPPDMALLVGGDLASTSLRQVNRT